MKANADKYHLVVIRDTDVTAKIGDFDVKNSREEKLLGVKIDNKLYFESHISSLCKKASQKLHALARVVNFVDLAKRKSLIEAFSTSVFNYFPLIWTFHSRQLNNRINKIKERALRLVCKDNKLTFNDFFKLDSSVTIYQRKIQIPATEIFKVKNLRSEARHFKREKVESTHHDIQCMQHLGLKIWTIVPQNIRESNSLSESKRI